ncbi:Imm49 family immunity protein [Nubsella zeaxanthinifaciens]|uniref:Imm49 family immunity protein n=1 Tax=Nubsella zeaxanthinifaciens TaxID=392412 RepID=UPI003D01B027
MLTINEVFRQSIEDEQNALARLASCASGLEQKRDEEMLWHCNYLQGLGYFFVERNMEAAKQCFYRAGRIDEYLIKTYDSRVLDSGIANITYALLSDNIDLIKRYALLGHSKYRWMVESGHSTLMYAIQQSILEDWEEVQWSLEIMATKNEKLNKVLLSDRKFLENLMLGDIGKMEEALLELLKDHKKRNKYMGIAQYYISIPAIAYVKLAWLMGIEINVGNELIPYDLLPYRPILSYDDKYTFLKSFK